MIALFEVIDLPWVRLVWKDRNGYGCFGSCLHRATS
jgi:hypothetical protein